MHNYLYLIPSKVKANILLKNWNHPDNLLSLFLMCKVHTKSFQFLLLNLLSDAKIIFNLQLQQKSQIRIGITSTIFAFLLRVIFFLQSSLKYLNIDSANKKGWGKPKKKVHILIVRIYWTVDFFFYIAHY